MLLGFMPQFERKIRAHEKRHTIRAPRKGRRQIRVGDRLDCYVNPRRKTMRLLGRWPCTSVQEISIKSRRYAFLGLYVFVKIDGIQLKPDEFEQLARADGFKNGDEFVAFWQKRMPFRGQIIHWDPTKPMKGPRRRARVV